MCERIKNYRVLQVKNWYILKIQLKLIQDKYREDYIS